jgi:hypothetical protein
MRQPWYTQAWKRRPLPIELDDDRRVYPPPPHRGPKSSLWVRAPVLDFNPNAPGRWQVSADQALPPLPSIPALVGLAGALTIRAPTGGDSETFSFLKEALSSGLTDTIVVDDQNKDFVTSFSPWVDLLMHRLSDVDHLAQAEGVILPGKLFEAVRHSAAHHLIPPVHTFYTDDPIGLHVHFELSPVSAWKIAKKWAKRWWVGACSGWEAFKGFLIEFFSRHGIGFALKKAGVLVVQWAWGTTAALLLGPVMCFAGLFVGTLVGDFFLSKTFELARRAVAEYEQSMKRSLDLRIEQTLRDMAVAPAREERALTAARQRARHAAEAELAALQRLDLDTATCANRRFIALLQRLKVALDRDRPHRIAYYLRPILERCAETDKQARLEHGYARAQTLLDEGLRSLDDKNPFKALAQFSEWLSTVNIDYKPLRRALRSYHDHLIAIEQERLRILKNLWASQLVLASYHRQVLQQSLTELREGLERERDEMIQEAERRLKTLRTEGEKIGLELEIQTPWPRGQAVTI